MLSVRVTAKLPGLPNVAAESAQTRAVPYSMTSLTVASVRPTAATVAWTRLPGAVGYEVEWKSNVTGLGGRKRVGDVASTAIIEFAPGQSYTASVQAVFADFGTSPVRSVGIYTPPANPSGPRVKKVSKTSVKVQLRAAKGATSYVLTYRTGSAKAKSKVVRAGTTAVTVKGLKKNKSYTMTLTAVSQHGVKSSTSSRVTVKTKK